MKLFPAILAVAAVVAACIAGAASAAPTYSPGFSGGEHMGKLIGGNGGGQFQSRCQGGDSYLAGLEVTTNERISTVKLICATRQGAQLVSPARSGPDIGAPQSGRYSAICPNGGAINGIDVLADGYDIIGVWKIDLRCSDAHGALPIGQPTYIALAGSAQLDKTFSTPTQADGSDECPPSYIAKGVWGHYGVFIDSIGLICDWSPAGEDAPAPPPAPPPKPIKVTGRLPVALAPAPTPRPASAFNGAWTVTADGAPFTLQLMLIQGATMGGLISDGNPADKGALRGILQDATHAQFIVAQDGHGRSGTINVTLGSDGDSFTGSGVLSGVFVPWRGTRTSTAP